VPQQAAPAIFKVVGTIKTIHGSNLIVTSDNGAEASIEVDGSTRIVRVQLGQKDLKSATPLKVSDLGPGDRVVVRGTPPIDGNSVHASLIMAMARADVAARQEHEEQEWQQHGIGGLVTSVDPAASTVTIVRTMFGEKKTTTVHVQKNTILRRYAPDSVNFQDAKLATLDQIKSGDQLRARGMRSANGNEFTADEIVAGTFRNIAGTVISTDLATNSISVMDAITKKPVRVNVSADSQFRKLPPEMAQRVAMRLKQEAPDSAPANGSPAGANGAENPSSGQGASLGTGAPARRNAGAPDLQQMVSRAPTARLQELQKGDAVFIVSTEGATSGSVTAITLLSGVEPILAASPKGGEGMKLSPWSLGGGGGEEASQ